MYFGANLRCRIENCLEKAAVFLQPLYIIGLKIVPRVFRSLLNYVDCTSVYATDRSKAVARCCSSVGFVVFILRALHVLKSSRAFCPCVFFFFFVFFSFILTLWSPRLGKRELVCVLLVHLFVCFVRVSFCHFPLPLGVGAWQRFVIVALLRLSINVFFYISVADCLLVCLHFVVSRFFLLFLLAPAEGCYLGAGRRLRSLNVCATPWISFHCFCDVSVSVLLHLKQVLKQLTMLSIRSKRTKRHIKEILL